MPPCPVISISTISISFDRKKTKNNNPNPLFNPRAAPSAPLRAANLLPAAPPRSTPPILSIRAFNFCSSAPSRSHPRAFDFCLLPIRAFNLEHPIPEIRHVNIINHPNVAFKYIAVGNEVNPGPLAQYVLGAMSYVINALGGAGLTNKIRVSTVVHLSVLGKSYPPSAGEFSGEAVLEAHCSVLD